MIPEPTVRVWMGEGTPLGLRLVDITFRPRVMLWFWLIILMPRYLAGLFDRQTRGRVDVFLRLHSPCSSVSRL